MASRRSRSTAKPRRRDTATPKLRVINIRYIEPDVYRFLTEGRGSQGLRSWLPYFVMLEKFRRVIVEDARKEPATPLVSKLRTYLAAAGLLLPGGG